MFFKKKVIFILILSSLIFLGSVSASESISNGTCISNDFNDELISIDNSYEDSMLLDSSENSNPSLDNSYVVFVGNNVTSDGGNGSYENPFENFNLISSSDNSYKDEITINIFEGTYYMTPNLLFNTSKLNIVGINGSVILKNSECVAAKSASEPGSLISFGLVSNSGNFTMSNVIFDSSDWNLINQYVNYFVPCASHNSNQTFNNCTFTGYNGKVEILSADQKNVNYFYNECKFIDFENTRKFGDGNGLNINVTFEYCIFTAAFNSGIGLSKTTNTIFDSIWWGQNSITKSYFYTKQGKERYKTNNFQFTRYAIFDVSENYLGNNQYEIIGKLMWNDTTDDDIEKLGPMTVTLSSSSGNFSTDTPILQDGTFRVIYNSNASTHEVTAKLDNEIITLNFNTVDLFVDASDVIFGQNTNITVTLPQALNGTISINVNNNEYEVPVVNTDSIQYVIPDVLPAGTHNITVTFVDETCTIYGFNTTTTIVSKASQYDFDATITPNTVYIGDNASVTLLFPKGATGNVTVKVGENEAKTFNVSDVISINEFIIGNNVVNITYNGNDNYNAKSIVKNVIASDVNISYDGNLIPGEKLIIKVEIPYATGKVTIIVNGDKNTTELVDNVATYAIDELTAGSYYITAMYAGDDLFDFAYKTDSFDVVKSSEDLIKELNDTVNNQSSTIEAQAKEIGNLTDTVNNQSSTIEAQAKEIGNLTETIIEQNESINKISNPIATIILVKNITATATATEYLTISLIDASTNESLANKTIEFTVDGKTDSVTTNASGVATVKVNYNTVGTRYYTFTFLGEVGYGASITSAKVVVNKKATKITAPKKTFKVKKTKKVQVKLTADKTVLKNKKVTLKVKGKTYTAKTNSKGIATFKITKLTKKGTFKYTVKFAGDNTYKAVSKNGKITIK